MRYLGIAVLLLAAACQQQKSAAKAPHIAFDGAEVTNAAATLAHGERLSHVLGCRGCHTANLEGQWFNDDEPDMGKLYASNLTRVIPTMTDAQLESLLRTGRHPTRGDLWIMPSEIFQRLSDADMKALIAHLRTLRPSGSATPPPALSAKAKAEVASGELKPVATSMADYRAHLPADVGQQTAQGRYIVGATCAECHGAELEGVPDFQPHINTPNLDIAGAYSDAELTTLLTTGQGKTKRDLGLMTLVGKKHFGYLTPHERSAVIAYLKARAARPQ